MLNDPILLVFSTMFLLTFIQYIALTPLKKLNLSSNLIGILAVGFIVPTAGLAFIIENLLPVFYVHTLFVSFALALLVEYLVLILFIKRKKYEIDKQKKNKIQGIYISKKEIILLTLLVSTLYFLFINHFTLEQLTNSGDVPALIDLTSYLTTFTQRNFSLTYTFEAQQFTGNFYPWAGYIFGALITTYTSAKLLYGTILTVLFIGFFSYIFSMYFLAKLLKVPKPYLILIFIIITNNFPVSLILAGNYTLIYGVVGSITLLNVYFITKDLLTNLQKVAYFILSIIVLLPLHPSAIITFFLILFSITLLFYDNIPLSFETNKFKKLIKIHHITFSIFLIGIGVIIWYFTKYELNNLLGAFLNSIPSRTSLSEFLSSGSLLERVYDFTFNNIMVLSYWNFLPSFSIIFFILIFSALKYKKKRPYFIPILIYLLFIFSSSISGISPPLKYLSVLSLPYYSSPIRINHLGVLIYTLYVSRFTIDFFNNQAKKVVT